MSQTRVSTELIIRTQLYTLNGESISLSHIEDQGSLSIEETDSTQAIKTHVDDTDNTLIYIDGRNQYILAKQVTSQSKR